ncbi:MAG: flavin reductase family protein [Bdellovibrionales bacterium]|nr:flavin reductase family protein [Bdellovibrionales bacterium]
MLFDMKALAPVDRYRLMIQTIVPRPIAWTLSRNENHSYNLAPFSYFNALHSDPPLVMISIGNRREGTVKDTRRNIEREKLYVIHIASSPMAATVTQSANPLPAESSEVTDCGLELSGDWNFPLPRLKLPKVAMGCQLERVIEIGKNRQGLLFGEIQTLYVEDSVCKQDGDKILVDAAKLDPLGRLGGDDYGTLGKVLTVKRPAYVPH